jgi:hypothetical protein
MATLVNKTIANGGPVNCHILQETLFGGIIRRTTRTLYTDAHSAWPHFRRRTTREYSVHVPLPQLITRLLITDAQYGAIFLLLATCVVG